MKSKTFGVLANHKLIRPETALAEIDRLRLADFSVFGSLILASKQKSSKAVAL